MSRHTKRKRKWKFKGRKYPVRGMRSKHSRFKRARYQPRVKNQ